MFAFTLSLDFRVFVPLYLYFSSAACGILAAVIFVL